MQILGLSDSTPQPENRAKMLFWPAIRTPVEADSIAQQGFWVCMIVASVTFAVVVLFQGFLSAIFDVAFFILGGIGVRERSRFASIAVLVVYVAGTLLRTFSILAFLFAGLLLANVRGTWLAAKWKDRADELPPRLNETIADKLCDQLPPRVWPWARWVFYPLTALELLGVLLITFFGTQ